MLIPLMTEDVIKCIKQESYTFKQITESFDSIFNDISLINNGNDVQLVDSIGNIIIAPLENYIKDEIMNYCSIK